MARNRVIYQSKAVYAGPDKNSTTNEWANETLTNDPVQLKRVQSANYGFDIARTDVNQFGDLAAVDRVILESPTVNFDTSWYLCNFFNEDKIGLSVNTDTLMSANTFYGILGDVLSSYAGERNYYVRVVSDGSDADSVATGILNSTEGKKNSVIGIGNGFLSNWSAEAAVGGFPTASVTVEGLNINFVTGSTTGFIPAVSPTDGSQITTYTYALSGANSESESADSVKVIKPGEISLSLPGDQGGAMLSDMKIQSFNCAVDLAREPLQKLGSRFAFSREITFPVTATLSVDALVGELASGRLNEIVDNNVDQEIIVHMTTGTAGVGAGLVDHMAIVMKKAKLDSQSFSQGIGDNETVTLNWSAQVGDKTDNANGLFLSGNKS